MGYVKTPAEIADFQQRLGAPRFLSARMLSVQFKTRRETVARLLPPGLTPAAEPIAIALIGEWRHTNCIEGFAGGHLSLLARHGEHEGAYCLSMPMSTDRAILFGRDLFGEPKKLARVTLEVGANRAHGRIERWGQTVLEIDASLGAELGPAEGESHAFHYKFFPASNGIGLEADPVLVLASFRSALHRTRSATATLRLGATAHDPLAEVEIVELLSAAYSEGDVLASARSLATVDRQAFLPYAYGKVDDWTLLDNEHERAQGAQRAAG